MRMVAALIACAFCIAASRSAESLDPDVLKATKSATVFLRVVSGSKQTEGSGFFVGRNLVATNAHVLAALQSVAGVPSSATLEVVLNSGAAKNERVLKGTLVGYDVECDLAFVRIDPGKRNDLPDPLVLADSKSIVETLPVYIFGFPFGDQLSSGRENPSITIGPGSVSSLRYGPDNVLKTIQFNGNLNPGNSGGPIVDKNGRLVAVAVATIKGTQIGFGVPGDDLARALGGQFANGAVKTTGQKGESASYSFLARTVDPLEKIAYVAVTFWTGYSDYNHRIDPKTRQVLFTGQDSGPRTRKELTKLENIQYWEGKLEGFYVPKYKNVYCQFSYRTQGGEETFSQLIRAEEFISSAPPLAPPVAVQGGKRESPKPVPPTGAERPRDNIFANSICGTAAARNELDDKRRHIMDVAVQPNGKVIYAAYVNEQSITAYDPATFSELAKIPLPCRPTNIWCDNTRLLVTSKLARTIVVIDLETKQIVCTLKPENESKMEPLRIAGRTANSSYVTIWKTVGVPSPECLYLGNDSGLLTPEYTARMDSCIYASDTKRLIAQSYYRSPQTPQLEIYDLTTKKRVETTLRGLFGDSPVPRRELARCFETADRRRAVIPVVRSGVPENDEACSQILSMDQLRVESTVPGVAFAELPKEKLLVTWMAPGNFHDDPGCLAVICFADIATGKVVRHVNVLNLPRVHAETRKISPVLYASFNSGLAYVSGFDMVLSWISGVSGLTVIPCAPTHPIAPIAPVASTPINAAIVPTPGPPPARVKVGELVEYTVTFKRPEHAKKVVFKLTKSILGMEIDETTGKISLTASSYNAGRYPIAVAVDVDGVEQPVLNWEIYIESKR